MEEVGSWVLNKGKKFFNLNDNLRLLEMKLKRLSARKSDFGLQVTKAERSGTKKRKMEVENWFEEVVRVENEFNELKDRIEGGGIRQNAFSSGDEVKKMDENVVQLLDESNHFDGLLLEVSTSRGEPRVTTKLFGELFDLGLKTILAWLVDDKFSNIGIYGMGGVGKTTLAKHIHNQLLHKHGFVVYWVTVSQEFSIRKLQDDIAKYLGLKLSNEDDEDSRAAKLSRELVHRFVLILDDVWEEICLEKIGISIDENKCRLIFTTRSLQVCRGMNCQREHEVKTLGADESWDLFKTRLNLKTNLPPDVEEVAKFVTERCDGLPLGIITVAGSMRGITDIREWRTALAQLNAHSVGHDKMNSDVFPILEWSFNRLNEYQKRCFLYCALFPEDANIEREELINYYIWAELMPKGDSRSTEFDQGHTILNTLVRACLLEETTNYRGNECVRMHDLIRDMALRITNGNSILKSSEGVPRFLSKSIGWGSEVILGQKEWTKDLEAVSFYSKYSFPKREFPPPVSPECPKLSTLLLPAFTIKKIPDSFFRHMCGLKVLNLRDCGSLVELPSSISDMVNLTALILRSCRSLQSVPPLGKLKQLRELDLSGTEIQDLPQGLELLVSLERLYLEYCKSLKAMILPKETFLELRRLQLLLLPPWVMVQLDDPEHLLSRLETFRGCLAFTSIYKIFPWPKYYYSYVSDSIPNSTVPYPADRKFDNVLVLRNCNLSTGLNFPVLLPNNVKDLEFSDCVGMGIRCLSNAFLNFASLNNLSRLEINGLDGVEFLWQLSSAPVPRDQLVDSSFNTLPNLQRLTLRNLPNLVGFFCGGSEPYLLPPGTFSSLTDLFICKCHNMKQLFTVQLLPNLQNLQALNVCVCEGLEEIVADDNGVGIQSPSSEATTPIMLPKLRLISLRKLPELRNICKAAMICESIGQITIVDCPKVKRLPLYLSINEGLPSPPSTLYRIDGNAKWWEALEWDNPYAKNALGKFFSAMERC